MILIIVANNIFKYYCPEKQIIMKHIIALGVALFFLYSCAPTRYYKPLDTGEHAVHASFGGPIIQVPGIATMPIPFTSVGYGYGLRDNLTLYGSWQTTSAIFGVIHTDFGATMNIWHNETMGVSVSPGFTFLIDGFDWKPSLYPQLDLNYYWTYGRKQDQNKSQDFYVGFDNWLDLRARLAHDVPNTNRLIWNTHIGHSFNRNLWSYQLELKLLAPYINNNVVVDYVSPLGDNGAVGFYFGVKRIIGRK
jgi:hypothetical protein